MIVRRDGVSNGFGTTDGLEKFGMTGGRDNNSRHGAACGCDFDCDCGCICLTWIVRSDLASSLFFSFSIGAIRCRGSYEDGLMAGSWSIAFEDDEGEQSSREAGIIMERVRERVIYVDWEA